MAKRKLVSIDEAVITDKQHIKPCSDCPWTRDSLNGWLGGTSPQDWIATAHSDEVVACHTLIGHAECPHQCAGIAIYRRNVAKMAYPPNLRLEADRKKVFASPTEFIDHHSKLPISRKKK